MLVLLSDSLGWWGGHTVFQCIQNLINNRDETHAREMESKPLRVVVENVYRVGGVGTVVTVKVVTGILRVGSSLHFSPVNISGTVANIEQSFVSAVDASALPGEMVGISIPDIKRCSLYSGCVGGEQDNRPPSTVTEVTAEVLVLGSQELRVCFSSVMYIHLTHVAICILDIIGAERTSKRTKIDPKSLQQHERGTVRIYLKTPVSLECKDFIPRLSRFVLFDHQRVVAAGCVLHFHSTSGTLTKAAK